MAVSDSPAMLAADLLLFDLNFFNTIRNATVNAFQLSAFSLWYHGPLS